MPQDDGSTTSDRPAGGARTAERRTGGALLLAVALAGAGLVGTSTADAATTWDPYSYQTGGSLPTATTLCSSSTYYQVATLTEGGATNLYTASFQSDGSLNYSEVGPLTGINSIGVDPATGYMYGAVNSSTGTDSAGNPMERNDIVYIDRETGAVYDLGKIPGAANPSYAFNAGAFGDDGKFYVGRGGASAVFVLDFSAGPFTQPTVTSITTRDSSGSIVNLGADFTYSDGYLWGRADNNGKIIRVDAATGLTTTFDAPADMPSDAAAGSNASSTGGAFNFGNGNIGLVYNNGTTTQLSYGDPDNPVFTVVTNYASPSGQGTDATSCISNPADLSITKDADATVVDSQGTVTWTITVTNTGPMMSTGWTVTDTVPSQFTDVAALDAGATVTGSTVKYVGSKLDVGESTSVRISARAPATDVVTCLTNSASVSGNEADTNLSDNTAGSRVCVGRAPGLSVLKSADPVSGSQVSAGQVVTYQVVVTNTGNTDLSPVTVTDDLSDVLDDATFVDGSASASSGAAPTLSGTTLSWTGDLPLGASATLSYQVRVDQDVVETDRLVNHVVGQGEDPDVPGVVVPSNCTTGDEDGCTTEHRPSVPATPTPTPTSPSTTTTTPPDLAVTGADGEALLWVAGAALVLVAAGVTLGLLGRRRKG